MNFKTAFLGGEGKNGRMYDMFRHRVIFPVFDTNGEVVAFSGRRLNDNEEERKYINTSDTPVFKKSKILFGMNIAKNTESGTLILCEGAPDAIAMHQAGFDNAIATLGTAITPDQARIFAKYTKKVVICYDSDKAGQNAAQKAMRLLGEVGIDVRVIKLGGAKDPDEYIKAFGADKFREVISGAKSKFEYNLESLLSKYDINLPQDKINALKECEKLISEVYSKAEQDI